MEFNVDSLTPQQKQYWLQQLVAPRPIALASTIDRNGNVNLSPFSFFNLFSIDPPILVFSPSRRLRDNTTKHTLQNILEVPEVCINSVSYDMVQQTSLASCEYYKCVDEFDKAGFTKEPSVLIKPPRVRETPASFECKVLEVKPLGDNAGAGNLVICEVLYIHMQDGFEKQPDLVARLGGNWYARINKNNMFEVNKPNTKLGIGIDMLPGHIRWSKTLTGNHLGMLANVETLPARDESYRDERLQALHQYFHNGNKEQRIEQYAVSLLDQNRVDDAWQVLLSLNYLS